MWIIFDFLLFFSFSLILPTEMWQWHGRASSHWQIVDVPEARVCNWRSCQPTVKRKREVNTNKSHWCGTLLYVRSKTFTITIAHCEPTCPENARCLYFPRRTSSLSEQFCLFPVYTSYILYSRHLILRGLNY